MKPSRLPILFVLLSFFLAGCYINDDVATDQMGVRLNGGRIIECVGPGVYTDLAFFADLREISAATLTFSVEDPEVATKDNQLVGVSITIQARRRPDCESLKNLLTNWSAMVEDSNLVTVVSATAREGIKVGTRSFTLQELLDDRNTLSSKITEQIEADASKYSVSVVNVTIENIALEPRYAAQLQEKALLTAQIETELRRQDLIIQEAANNKLEQEQRSAILKAQLAAEKDQTAVQVEIASRTGKEIAARNEVYLENEPAYELERLRLMKDILGNRSVVYFIPDGTDITMLFNSNNNLVPLPGPEGE